MSASYKFVFRSPRGRVLAIESNPASIMYVRNENTIGMLELRIPYRQDYESFVGIDYIIEMWRAVDDNPPYLEGDTAWFIRKYTVSSDGSGVKSITINAQDAISLLNRRVVAFDSTASQADKYMTADKMMTEIAMENISTGGSGISYTKGRENSGLISVIQSSQAAPLFKKQFSRRNVYEVCKELADASKGYNVYLCFDIEYSTTQQFVFKTYIGQRGIDRSIGSQNPVVASIENGALASASLIYDHLEEANVIYAGGTGGGVSRTITIASDISRIGISPFGRVEKFVSANNATDVDRLQTEAEYYLRANRPKQTITAVMADAPTVLYGVHYNFGDRISLQYEGITMDSHISSVEISVVDGKEKISINVMSETLI